MFMELPDDEVYCASNKVMLAFEGVGIRLTNKSLNPSHLKYSMTPVSYTHLTLPTILRV